jgi:predicted MFS family arabinose efflux permease
LIPKELRTQFLILNFYFLIPTMLTRILSPIVNGFRGLSSEVWLLSAVSLINRSGSMVVAFLTLYLTQALHFDLRTAGYVMSCFGFGSIVGAYTGGYLTDKLGYYKVQLLTLLLSGTFLIVTLVVRDVYLMCLLMFLNGMASEAFRPANSVAIRTHSDAATRTRSLSLMRVAVNLAISFALIVGGILASMGWSWLFIADGLTCFGAAIILRICLKEKQPETGNLIASNKKEAPPDNLGTSPYFDEKIAQTIDYQASTSAYKDKKFLVFIFSTFVGACVFMQIIWTIPAFFKEIYGWNERIIGAVAAINGITVMVVEMPLIFNIENKKSKLWFVRFGIILYGLSYIAFSLPSAWGWLLAVFYMITISFGEIFVMPFSTNWAMKHAGEARQGQYMGLYTMAYSSSNVVAPLLGTQIIAAFGYSTLWLVLAALSSMAFYGFWWLQYGRMSK